ncbi:MAG: hypothetical protein VKS61_09405 [Candidatus Sericytochromatia bacterium]|nr:hypothetical protein [Candidatus Sericytochromatia bacterium]
MKLLLTGTVQHHHDDRHEATLKAMRRTRDGLSAEAFLLRFVSPDAYREFCGRHPQGAGVQVTGLVRQARTPLRDRATGSPLHGAGGNALHEQVLTLEVRESRSQEPPADGDLLYAHGMVGLVDKREGLKTSANGLPWLRVRVAYNHYKRPTEAEGQADYYDLVAFGPLAEGLAGLERGDRFIVDHAIPATSPYELREAAHSDGTPVTRRGLELTLKEFTFLPRLRATQRPEPEALPF